MTDFLSERSKRVIGYKYLMNQLSLKSLYGIKHYKAIQPYRQREKNELLKELNRLELFIERFQSTRDVVNQIELLMPKFKDIETTVINCLNTKTLDLVELYEIKIQAIYMIELRQLFNERFKEVELIIGDTSPIIKLLSNSSSEVTYDFYLYESYSNRLSDIREKKREIEQQFYRVNNREEQEKLKDQRSLYVKQEDEEELNVRKMLTKRLSVLVPVMLDNIKKVGHIDFLMAKSRLAIKYGGIKPTITDDHLVLMNMDNPSIKDQVLESGHYYTSNTIIMNPGTTVITGANMSGKSSVLKTVALNVLLAQLGFFVFAKQAYIPLFDSILYIGSENENHKHGLSSFGLEIASINEAIKTMKCNRSLICIDEFARSTNPTEGQKFVKAYASFSNTYDSLTMIATHYDGVVDLDMNHYQIAGLKEEVTTNSSNENITADTIHRYMDYTLKRVGERTEVPKEAYKVSLLLNIDVDFKRILDKFYGE